MTKFLNLAENKVGVGRAERKFGRLIALAEAGKPGILQLSDSRLAAAFDKTRDHFGEYAFDEASEIAHGHLSTVVFGNFDQLLK